MSTTQTTYEKLVARLCAKVEENERFAAEAFYRAIDHATGTPEKMEFRLLGNHTNQLNFLRRHAIEKHGFPENTTVTCEKYDGYTYITLEILRAKKVEALSTVCQPDQQ